MCGVVVYLVAPCFIITHDTYCYIKIAGAYSRLFVYIDKVSLFFALFLDVVVNHLAYKRPHSDHFIVPDGDPHGTGYVTRLPRLDDTAARDDAISDRHSPRVPHFNIVQSENPPCNEENSRRSKDPRGGIIRGPVLAVPRFEASPEGSTYQVPQYHLLPSVSRR